MWYAIKQAIIQKPEIELPVGSQIVSVKHHDTYTIGDIRYPECWQVVWLEPQKEEG